MPAISATPATDLAPNYLPTQPEGFWRDRGVLDRSWNPPVLVGREEVLAQLETSVLAGLTSTRGVAVSIHGPRGSGISTIAAHLVATAKGRLTSPGSKGAPLVLQADVAAHRSPSALVTALFREVDPSYDGRGTSAEFCLLLFLRRLRTMGRPAILLFDQIGAKMDLSRVLRPLARPDRLMPEGPAGLPTMLVVAAGERNALPEDVEAIRSRLEPLDHHGLCEAIQVRANLAFQSPPSRDVVEAIARLSVAQGLGLSMVGEMLAEGGRRAEARSGHRLEVEDVGLPAALPRHSADAEGFDMALLEVLRGARGAFSVGELRRRVAARCEDTGVRAPTQARLWRHLVGLERKGVVQREVHLGGAGGSTSVVSLVAESSSAPTAGAPHAVA
ncbi:MAG: hypothetical protein KGJ23_12660 [Euryarchaeota archaeon]|nr:hypothetical protein [Euryarchaeota archaeon]MDE1837450.1 hypothetical protein [Euryarchaeota archaeon]MDE2045584.1 hypothetical protein [Thermoplasmata archaeon]